MDHSHHKMVDQPMMHHGSEDDGSGCVFYHALTFHAGVCQEILFDGWRTTNALQVFGSAVALFVAGFLYEGFKYYRESLYKRATTVTNDSRVNITKTECGANGPCANTAVVKYTMLSAPHAIQTLFHIIQTTISYMLMLIFMTYNVWLCLGLVLGMGLGYFVFGWKKNTVVDVTEHCQ